MWNMVPGNPVRNDGRTVGDYIRLLELLMFDSELFKKEFNKTKGWVTNDEMEEIEEWFRTNHDKEIDLNLIQLRKRS
jgi:type IV secretory pathway TrbF-like protein